MNICIICEGSYPYVSGGVSGWVQMIIKAFPEIDFKIWSIATNKEEMHAYKYELPVNVTEVKTIYINEKNDEISYKKLFLKKKEKEILRKFLTYDNDSWESILEFIQKYRKKLFRILKSEDFCDIVLDKYLDSRSTVCFNEYLWNYRGMYLPLLKILSDDIVKADIYHTVSTGYAGMLGSVASFITKKPLILSEHGIYTREREEDIIRSSWVDGYFKELWIHFFKNLSNIVYQKADVITSLFQTNVTLQEELGCPKEKIKVICNGIDTKQLGLIQRETNKNTFDVGAIIRVVPIKDIKTMIIAFYIAKQKIPNMKLHLLGNYDESKEYYEECVDLVHELGAKDIIFYGQVNIKEHLSKFDVTLLSSISEGQPLAVLEAMAAGIPQICTNVGCCTELLEGKEGDELGKAGFIVPVMDPDAMAAKIVYMAKHRKEAEAMGVVAKKRVQKYYTKKQFLDEYRKLYHLYGEF